MFNRVLHFYQRIIYRFLACKYVYSVKFFINEFYFYKAGIKKKQNYEIQIPTSMFDLIDLHHLQVMTRYTINPPMIIPPAAAIEWVIMILETPVTWDLATSCMRFYVKENFNSTISSVFHSFCSPSHLYLSTFVKIPSLEGMRSLASKLF